MTTPNETVNERARQIACLVNELPNDPTASRRLADACLAFGLGNGGRLSLAAMALADRTGELDDGVLVELQSVVEREQERRRRRERAKGEGANIAVGGVPRDRFVTVERIVTGFE